MPACFKKLIGTEVEGVFPLRGIIVSNNLCEDEYRVSEITAECFRKYQHHLNLKTNNERWPAPKFIFGVTMLGNVVTEYYIDIYVRDTYLDRVRLKTEFIKGTKILVFELVFELEESKKYTKAA